MRMILRRMGVGMIIVGIVLLIYAAIIGEAHLALLLIFPVVYGNGVYSMIGIFLIIIGIFILFLSPFSEMPYHEGNLNDSSTYAPEYSYYIPEDIERPQKKTRYGGIILIGPIPIVFGSDKNMTLLSILVGILMVLGIVFAYLFYIH